MARYVLDTNVYVAADRDVGWAEELARFSSAYLPFIHFHAVVAQEADALERDYKEAEARLESARQKLFDKAASLDQNDDLAAAGGAPSCG